jgi:hypothetical protein
MNSRWRVLRVKSVESRKAIHKFCKARQIGESMFDATPESQALFYSEIQQIVGRNPELSIHKIWNKLSRDAQIITVMQIALYLRLWPEEASPGLALERETEVGKRIRKEVKSLLRASSELRWFIGILPDKHNHQANTNVPLYKPSYAPLDSIVTASISRLKREMEVIQHVATIRRLGKRYVRARLIFAQEYVRAWSLRHLGDPLELHHVHIAELIEITERAVGGKLKRTDPEVIRKKIAGLRRYKEVSRALVILVRDPELYVTLERQLCAGAATEDLNLVNGQASWHRGMISSILVQTPQVAGVAGDNGQDEGIGSV